MKVVDKQQGAGKGYPRVRLTARAERRTVSRPVPRNSRQAPAGQLVESALILRPPGF